MAGRRQLQNDLRVSIEAGACHSDKDAGAACENILFGSIGDISSPYHLRTGYLGKAFEEPYRKSRCRS